MNILLIDSTFPINSRNERILGSLIKLFPDASINVVTWNRDGRNKEGLLDDRFNYHFHNELAAYGSALDKLFKLYSFYCFLKKINKLVQANVIIASHWDMLFLSALIKKKNQKLVYENLDVPTARWGMLIKLISMVEKFGLKRTDFMILASRFYKDLYYKSHVESVVIENLPSETLSNKCNIKHNHIDNDKLKVSFLGNIRYLEVLKNLINATEGMQIQILLWGGGPDLQRIIEYAQGKDHIHVFGKFDYKNIASIYDVSDIIWAVYPSKDFNVKYAISNKFHECIVFNKPGVFASSTKLGDLIEAYSLGYTVDPYDIKQIKKMFQDILINKPLGRETFDFYKKNNAIYWEDNEVVLEKIFNKIVEGDNK